MFEVESLVKILTPANLLFMVKCAGVSVLVAVCAVILGTILGIIGSIFAISKKKVLNVIYGIYVTIIRGTPMLLQVLFLFLCLPALMRGIFGVRFSPNPYVVGIIAISINSGAYSTELIRSGINGVDKGQWEAAMALGLKKSEIMKQIILPQAFKRIVPPLVNEFITLIKDSSLISTIGAIELTKAAEILGGRYYNYLIPLTTASIIYLILTVTISFFQKKLERKLAESD